MEDQTEKQSSIEEVLSKLSEFRVQFSGLDHGGKDTSKVEKSINEIIETNPHLLNTPSNESEALQLCFLSKYFGKYLPENVTSQFQDSLPKLKEQYPAIGNVESIISQIRNEDFDFFMSYGNRYNENETNFSIDLPPNPVASLIVKTEAKLIQDRKQHPSQISELVRAFSPTFEGNKLTITMTKKQREKSQSTPQ